MVYRGKPSAGCENCRKAKKRCDLEQPACSRCVKLKKTCCGYRDTSGLRIRDESETVRLKANLQNARTRAANTNEQFNVFTSGSAADYHSLPDLPGSEELSTGLVILNEYDETTQCIAADSEDLTWEVSLPFTMRPSADEVATTHFFSRFTSRDGHWMFLRDLSKDLRLHPVLDLATRACGMAALDNVESVAMGKEYSTARYAQALCLLNLALRDPKKCKDDSTLIAVTMLGYYENLTCNSRASIQSWKAHIDGATQLLKLRGKEQFRTEPGRILFREVRAQILIRSVWDDLEPPAWIQEYEEELNQKYPEPRLVPASRFLELTMEFASLRARMRLGTIPDKLAMERAGELERGMIQWLMDTMENELWGYTELEVEESPHVWNGIVHSYVGGPAATVWNTYRSMRILLTRTQELLCYRLQLGQEQLKSQQAYFRSVRRRMTDEICYTIPVALGHASPAFNSPCVTITGYGSIWPLFFAGTCALERVPGPKNGANAPNDTNHLTSAAAAQSAWIIGRMEYISKDIGVKWADGVAAVLKGDFRMYQELKPITSTTTESAGLAVFEAGDSISPKRQFWHQPRAPAWVKKVEQSGRGARILLEKESPLSDALHEPRDVHGPIWLGRDAGGGTGMSEKAST